MTKKVKLSSDTPKKKEIRPALTPEARENQMIDLAVNLAEQQLRDGTAKSQVIVHFLKLGTPRSKLEQEKIEYEKELLKAKTENLMSQQRTEELYQKAIDAMRRYNGSGGDEDDEYDEEY